MQLAFLSSAKDIGQTCVIGAVATAFTMGLQWSCQRLGLLKGGRARAIGAFIIPEPSRNRFVEEGLQVLAGVFFTIAYMFVFQFVELSSIRSYASLGAMIGFVHGYFISFFVATGFSHIGAGKHVQPFTIKDPLLNMGAQALFGLLVGLGAGFAQKTGTVWNFLAYVAAGSVAIGLTLLIVPASRPKSLFYNRQKLRHQE